MAGDRSSELLAEREAVDHILDCHLAYLDQSRRVAERLAGEAAEAIEDGIRDIIDEDAEADAAIRAVLVRQTSQRAMHAARRVVELESQGDALAFGHMTDDEGEKLYIGRRTVMDGDEALLVDWRARAAIPFYRATPVERLGLVHRRHLIYDDPSPATVSTLVDFSDELFDPDELGSAAMAAGELRGEAALLAGLNAATGDGMRSVVATIQTEQDAVIRAPADRTLVVQGGPGTGKTVVALHRAAYLLYDRRVELTDSGVLVVGPSPRFLRYIAGVLPSLGESGVMAVTIDKLYRGASARGEEPAEVAELKGRAVMADLLAIGLSRRRRRPTTEFRTWYGSRRVTLSTETLGRLFDRALRHPQHNAGAAAFRSLVLERLGAEVYESSFHDMDDARLTFETSSEVERLLLAHFPPLSPEQALNDLLGSAALLRFAGRQAGLDVEQADALFRPRTPERELRSVRWTDADMALLDELLDLLGPVDIDPGEEAIETRDERTEFELADAEDEEEAVGPPNERDDDLDDVLPPFADFDDPWIDDESDLDELDDDNDDYAGEDGEDQLIDEYRGVVESDGTPIGELELESVDVEVDESVSLTELASRERSWQFGHVIVDEAQDLSPMDWRMVVRRTIDGGLTIVGDLAQRSAGGERAAGSWAELLPASLAGFELKELTINYRSPVEIDPLLHAVLAAMDTQLTPARSIRRSGCAVEVVALGDHVDLARLVGERSGGMEPNQRLAVVVDPADPRRRDLEGLRSDQVSVLSPADAKGLEFESVIVVEPSLILGAPHGLNQLYVALSRATSRLTIAHSSPLPPVIESVVSGADGRAA